MKQAKKTLWNRRFMETVLIGYQNNGREIVIGTIKQLLITFVVLELRTIANLSTLFGSQRIEAIKDLLFFTHIGLFYTIFCILTGLFKDSNKTIQMVYEFVLATSVVLEIIITALFWTLFYINPGFVKDEYMKNKTLKVKYLVEMPKHLFPLVILVLELSHLQLHRSPSHKIFFIFFCTSYCLLLEIYFLCTKTFLYPFLGLMNLFCRLGFFVVMGFASLIIYELLMFVKK